MEKDKLIFCPGHEICQRPCKLPGVVCLKSQDQHLITLGTLFQIKIKFLPLLNHTPPPAKKKKNVNEHLVPNVPLSATSSVLLHPLFPPFPALFWEVTTSIYMQKLAWESQKEKSFIVPA